MNVETTLCHHLHLRLRFATNKLYSKSYYNCCHLIYECENYNQMLLVKKKATLHELYFLVCQDGIEENNDLRDWLIFCYFGGNVCCFFRCLSWYVRSRQIILASTGAAS